MEKLYYLFNIGKNFQAYKCLGAKPSTVDGEAGFFFSVWAPNARDVSVVGDFNRWSPGQAPMRKLETTGIWEAFVPGAKEDQCYKFYVVGQDGEGRYKADPFALKSELRPNEASVLYVPEEFSWNDEDYLAKRAKLDRMGSPINIYEVHLPSWRTKEDGSPYTFREIAPILADYVSDMGYTHVELMPIMEYPYDGSWGYQLSGYFSPTRRLGDLDDFNFFINHLHDKNIGVILDWVPAHFPIDEFCLAYFDGSPCFEYQDKLMAEHQDWGTLVFDYGKAEVRSFLFSSAVYWLEECHADGIRVDAVSSMLYRNYSRNEYTPNAEGGTENFEAISFLQELNTYIHNYYPGVLSFAEESTSWPKVTHNPIEGGLGFDFKWDMGWMHDTLEYFQLDYIYRSYHHNKITFSMLYNFHERFLLSISHDEVVHGKGSLISRMPGDFWRQFASVRIFFAYMMGHPGAKFIFMGSEFGQFIEWRFYEELEWFLLDYDMHHKLHEYVKTLNHMYLDIPAFWEDDKTWEGFQWLNADDQQNSVYSWYRKDKSGRILVFVYNMTPAPVNNYKLPMPRHGQYKLILNSDAAKWGGSDYEVMLPRENTLIADANKEIKGLYTWDTEEEIKQDVPNLLPSAEGGNFQSRAIQLKGYNQSMKLNLPPLSCLVFSLEEEFPLNGVTYFDPEVPLPEDDSRQVNGKNGQAIQLDDNDNNSSQM